MNQVTGEYFKMAKDELKKKLKGVTLVFCKEVNQSYNNSHISALFSIVY
jgi:hypothetical protein